MSWQNEMVRILRYLINDLDESSPTYGDARLEETLIVAAQLVFNELEFDKTYTIEVDECSISPDPTAGTKDNGFINLVSLKAACIILGSEAKTLAAQSFRIVDGPSQIETKDAYKSAKELHKDMCEAYTNAKIQHTAGSARVGHAIITPTTDIKIGGSTLDNFA